MTNAVASSTKKATGEAKKLSNAVWTQIKSLFESQEKNQFMDCCFKLSDVCLQGVPHMKPGSKQRRMFLDKLDLLFSLLRSNRQKQGLTEVMFQELSHFSGAYSPEIVVQTICLAILLQFPRRDLRWSDVELSGVEKSLTRLLSSVLPALDCSGLTDLGSRERLALGWCHGVLVFVLRSLQLFLLTKGRGEVDAVWETAVWMEEEETAGKAVRRMLNGQRRMHKAVAKGRGSGKVSPQSLMLLLRSLVAEEEDEVVSERKRRLSGVDRAEACPFEVEEEEEGVERKRRKEEDARSSEQLLSAVTAVSDEAGLLSLNADDTVDFLLDLDTLRARSQALKTADRRSVLSLIVLACRNSSPLLARTGGRRGEVTPALLQLWLFLLRRSHAEMEFPLLRLSLLLCPDLQAMPDPLFLHTASLLPQLLLLLLRRHAARLLAAPQTLLLPLRALMAEVMRRAGPSTSPTHADALAAALLPTANLLMRLCDAERRAEVSRVVRVMLEEYLVRAAAAPVHTTVKRGLMQLLTIVLDAIDNFTLEQVKLEMKAAPRELLKQILTEYRARKK